MAEAYAAKKFASPYEFFILGLCIFALISIAVDTFLHLDNATRTILIWADTGICIIFFFDFLISFFRAENRWRYLITWGWIDLLSSVPTIDMLRWGRIARICRVFRLMRGVRATRVLTSFILGKRRQSTFLAAALISIVIVTFASIAILQFEGTSESNIKTAGDAIWWSVVTLTTVGYDDLFPVTAEGRMIGIMLTIIGVGLFGIISGFVASWFLSPGQKEEKSEIEILRHEISELRSTIIEYNKQFHVK